MQKKKSQLYAWPMPITDNISCHYIKGTRQQALTPFWKVLEGEHDSEKKKKTANTCCILSLINTHPLIWESPIEQFVNVAKYLKKTFWLYQAKCHIFYSALTHTHRVIHFGVLSNLCTALTVSQQKGSIYNCNWVYALKKNSKQIKYQPLSNRVLHTESRKM